MVSCYVREQKRYSKSELCELFQCSEETAIRIIKKLKEYGVLNVVRKTSQQKDMSDLVEADIEITNTEYDSNDLYYVFPFVGVITVAGTVLKCYPKYLLSNSTPKDELKQVMKVLEKYNTKKQIIKMFNDAADNSTFNLLAVLLFLLNDYYENGSYNNMQQIIESNGTGEILWDKTINESFTLLSKNRPFYTNLQTKKSINDDFDYLKRLHACLLTKASKELQDADLLDLFEITEVNLSYESIDDFGEKTYILDRLEYEMNTQFNTRKQLVLKALYVYISHNGNLYESDALSMIGTTSFNLVWETVCSDILDNQLNKTLDALQLPKRHFYEYAKIMRLSDIIEKPFWSASGKTADETLEPDIVSISGDSFYIFDAKYYNVILEPGYPPKAQPGIESVTKQYLYQLAFQKFIAENGFSSVKNCFLLPTEEKEIIDKGEVSMKLLESLGLHNIQVRFLPARQVYNYYLSGIKMDIDTLRL